MARTSISLLLSAYLVQFIFFVLVLGNENFEPGRTRGIGVNPGPVVQATKGKVWPKPQQVKELPNFMVVRPNEFTFKVIKNDCDILQDAIQRYSKIIKTQVRKKRMVKNMETENKSGDVIKSKEFAGYLDALKINLMSPCETMPHVNMDEKYELKINTPDLPKDAHLISSSIWGILRGLETFSQLLYTDNSPGLIVNSTMISDFPRFPHRGLLLDTSRHYIPLKIIYLIIDAMSMNKFNVFHWHIVDDHSFPYQSTSYPRLNQYGAYTPKHIYTQDDVKNVIRYCTLRGIRVIAEFDSPDSQYRKNDVKHLHSASVELSKNWKGINEIARWWESPESWRIKKSSTVNLFGHTRSWGEGHPEILTKCYSKNVPDGSLGPMNPIINVTYAFMDQLLKEIKTVFPDKFTHLGGDEVDYACWQSNPDIVKYVQEKKITFANLEEMYVKKIIDLAKAKSFKCIVWQEVFDNGLNVPKDTIIHVWKGGNFKEELSFVTSSGYTALLSSPWYLDHVSSGGDWIKFYNIDPLGFNGTDEQKKRLLGGEACMWSEHVDSNNILTRIWPRACATAEKLWSPGKAKSYQEAARRLEEHVCRMNMRGISTQPANGPGFCPFVNF